MVNFLNALAQKARETINKGYYEVEKQVKTKPVSLKKAILECEHAPIIAEIKVASPSLGVIKRNANVGEIAAAMEKGGAVGISVLTEPEYFKGSLDSFMKVRKRTKLPLLMKDVIISTTQLEVASRIGANAVLLIGALFDRKQCECDVHDMIDYARSRNLDVLLEVHTLREFLSAFETDADLIGINNRDLQTLKVDLQVTKRILHKIDPQERIIVSESGIKTPADVRFLHECGAHAFLIGSTIMMADNVQKKVGEFVAAL